VAECEVPRGTKLVLLAITSNNDLRRGVDPSQHAANASSIVGHIRALGAKVIRCDFPQEAAGDFLSTASPHSK
jgi:hypothetical protein